MRAVVQRVKYASVRINGSLQSSIQTGLLVYLGIKEDDQEKDSEYIIQKILNLRVFDDANKVPNLSVMDTNGSILIVSQFTLYGDARHGRRPSYIEAGKPDNAKPLYDSFVEKINTLYPQIFTGIFQAEMEIESVNDGPFTILLDSRRGF